MLSLRQVVLTDFNPGLLLAAERAAAANALSAKVSTRFLDWAARSFHII